MCVKDSVWLSGHSRPANHGHAPSLFRIQREMRVQDSIISELVLRKNQLYTSKQFGFSEVQPIC